MNLAFLDKLISQIIEVKLLIIAVDNFPRFFQVQTMKTKFVNDILQAFKKIDFSKK